MIKHTFLDKVNTIVKGSKLNHGLNPVAELNYGAKVSRALVHFNETELVKMDEDGCFPDKTKLRHILKLTNCMSQDGVPYDKILNDGVMGTKFRAASFDILLFLLPKPWDAGRGFDFTSDSWIKNNRSLSTHGSNWYYAADHNPWRFSSIDGSICEGFAPVSGDSLENGYIVDENGMYTSDELNKEYCAYAKNIEFGTEEPTIIVSRQHFDFGNENFEFDITDTVNKIIAGELPNYGFGLAFSPAAEDDNCEEQYYVGFFTNRTNTFFHPYLETIYDDPVRDDRARFYKNKVNRLYFYSIIDNEYTNLDEIPTCEIDGTEFEVKQGGKGVYYVEIEPSALDVDVDTICYDKWSNLAYNGQEMEDVELEFVVIAPVPYFQLGAGVPHQDILIPQVYGINDNEKLRQGEVRRVVADFRKRYTTDKKFIIDSAEYRIYTMDADREIDVYPYHPVEKTFMENFFYVNTDEMIPGEYFVDFRVKANGETRYYRKELRFTVVSDITEYYN